jgi:hypothetical protein
MMQQCTDPCQWAWGMAVVVVEALCFELSFVVLSVMLKWNMKATPSVGVLCMVGDYVGLQAGSAYSTLITNILCKHRSLHLKT